MADHTVLNAGSGGDTINADDLGSAGKAQGVKVILGADGTNDGYVASGNPLPVALSASSLNIGDVDVLTVGGQTPTYGAGAVAAGTQRTTLASDDPAVTALQIIDDWDESDRAKVNPIVGSAGVAGGSGTVSAATQRVVLATDVALPAGTNAIGKLAENSGVDIGDVDVTTMPGTAAEGAALPAAFVVIAGDDGTDTQPLQLSAGGDLKITLDSETVVLGAGSAAFGKLAANSGVDIGDVDVTSVTPGTAAGSLGKAVDSIAGASDTGVAALAVRDDALATLTPADGDYTQLRVDSTGALWVNSELPAAAALADSTANPTVPSVGVHLMLWNGTTWDRAQSSVGALTTGTLRVNLATDIPTPHGGRATAHGSNPTADTAGVQGLARTNRHGVQFVIGGHPNPITRSVQILDADGAQTNASMVGTISAGTKVAVTRLTVIADGDNTGDYTVRIGFGASAVPAEATTGTNGILFSTTGLNPGQVVSIGDGSGLLGVGADGEELRLTCDDPAGGGITITFTYFTIES